MKQTIAAAELQLPLREDVRLLGDLLGITIKEQAGINIYTTIEEIRKLSKAAMSGNTGAEEQLTALLNNLPQEQLLPITKAFSQFLNFSNIAEQYHRIRRVRSYKMHSERGPQLGSLEDVLPKLKAQGINSKEIFDAICKLEVQLVLTSHPTEVKRRTVMRKYDRISTALQKLDTQILTLDEVSSIKDDLLSEMVTIWQTPEVPLQKPTPVDEAKWGFAIIESSLWHAVPMFMRELDHAVEVELGYELPLNFSAIKIDSWLGGDRDGNPNVTPEVTRRVAYIGRWVAADLLHKEIIRLRDSLSMKFCNTKLRSLVGDNSKEPYRDLLRKVQQRLKATRAWARDNFSQPAAAINPVYIKTSEILEPLMLCYESLIECKAGIVAQGRLRDIIRQVHCFGLSLVRMDIRQESAKHTQLIAAITRLANMGDYSLWTEQQRQKFLLQELTTPRGLITPELFLDTELQDLVQTFKLIAELPRDGLGSYIISMSSEPSDVLAVVLLQREFGVKDCLPVVPLFETSADLSNSSRVLEELFSFDVYRESINNCQQIMIGYSDSAKDVGMLAASWALYQAQENMLKVADKYGVQLLFFHGRGGSLGRGGWPTHDAILSQPPGSVRGVMRVTQQGEVMQNRFGLRGIAMRTLEVYTTSTLEASLVPPQSPKQEWREVMDQLTSISSANYKHIVVGDVNFIRYFQTATPMQELKKLAIGSRPATRGNTDSLSKLRAIPWIFAWTQNRLLLPSWAGVGAALAHAFEDGKGEQIVQMDQEWRFFHTVLSMCEMVLAKSDINVAKHYEQRLVPSDLFTLGADLRAQFTQTQDMLLKVLHESKLLQHNIVLDRSIQLRNPYLLPLHLLQVELLFRVREGGDNAAPEVINALMVSIAGIAAGMRNTG